MSGGRRCTSNPWPRLIALSHCSRRGISDCIRGLIHVSRGLPRGRLHEGEGQRPLRSWTAVHRALFAGTSSASLATCPKRARRRLLIGTEIGGKPVLSEMFTFFTMSCHLTPSIRLGYSGSMEPFPLNSGMMTPSLQSVGTRPVCHTFTKSA